MKNYLFLFAFIFIQTALFSQENIHWSNPIMGDILTGDFDPQMYSAGIVIDDPNVISKELDDRLDESLLKQYLEEMSTFENRNTGADTLSLIRGMGAARNWALDKFQLFSDDEGGRMQVGFLQFDQDICDMSRHKNIVAILPGSGPQYDESVLVEAHFDSRCHTPCDIDCEAHGMEDNGSGSALVLELARVLSRYSFNRTMVFMLTIGEEQGLHGAEAYALWCQQNDVKLKAVFNNDIVGGVICGETASMPGCPSLNHVDSTNVRIYSKGATNSPNKQLARWTKLQYEEMIVPITEQTNIINILTPEDRAGRGGDHMPFPSKGFNALRFTSANEHGDGNPADEDYHDRQHTSTDRLGLDTFGKYRVALREINNNDWLELRDFDLKVDSVIGLTQGFYILSACTVDDMGVESFFSREIFDGTTTSIQEEQLQRSMVHLMQNTPNPFDEATMISVFVEGAVDYEDAKILVRDLQGKEIIAFPLELNVGVNEVMYSHTHHNYARGVYAYSLIVDGQLLDTKKMIYAY